MLRLTVVLSVLVFASYADASTNDTITDVLGARLLRLRETSQLWRFIGDHQEELLATIEDEVDLMRTDEVGLMMRTPGWLNLILRVIRAIISIIRGGQTNGNNQTAAPSPSLLEAQEISPLWSFIDYPSLLEAQEMSPLWRFFDHHQEELLAIIESDVELMRTDAVALMQQRPNFINMILGFVRSLIPGAGGSTTNSNDPINLIFGFVRSLIAGRGKTDSNDPRVKQCSDMNGVFGRGGCCPSSCGKCGGWWCERRPGGNACCISNMKQNCGEGVKPPCKIPKSM